MNNKEIKWKDELLKSGLPLENYAAEILSKIGFDVNCEYSYVRKTEAGEEKQFSVDLEANSMLWNPKYKYWGRLNLLIECKYNHPNCKWIFMPCPEKTHIYSDLIHYEDALCTRRINKVDALNKFTQYYDYCMKGIVLNLNNVDSETIKHGIYQIRYAIPPYLKYLNSMQIDPYNDEDLYIDFLCPIILTTSPIYILKRGIPLNKIFKSNDLTDVAIPVDCLIIYNQPEPNMKNYVRDHLFAYSSEAQSRLDQINKVLDKKTNLENVTTWGNFYQKKLDATTSLLVINLKAFRSEMKILKTRIGSMGKSLIRVARLEIDRQSHKSRIEPLK